MRVFLDPSISCFDGGFVETNIHHRVPKSQTKNKRGGCPIRVSLEMHFYWHHIAQNMSPKNVAEVLNKCIYKKGYYKIVCERRNNHFKNKFYKQEFTYQKNVSDINMEDVIYYFYKMFKDKNPFEVCRIINKYFLDPNWRFVCKHKRKYLRIKPSYSINRPNCK